MHACEKAQRKSHTAINLLSPCAALGLCRRRAGRKHSPDSSSVFQNVQHRRELREEHAAVAGSLQFGQ
jgi:hypothetical protein